MPRIEASQTRGSKSAIAGSQISQQDRAYYPALDGLRALAFVMVFGYHYLQLPWGWAGVDLFFVLSGFLITGILFDSRNDPHRVRNFYIRRTLRIFPLYYGVMLALLLMEPVVHWHLDWRWLAWPAYLGNYVRFIHPYNAGDSLQKVADFQPYGAFRQGHALFFLGHFWSLCVEEQFYLVWPWLVFWIRDRKKLLWICAVTLPLCLAMRITGQHFLPHWILENGILNRATPFRFDALLLGGFLALALRGVYRNAVLRLARIAFPICLVLALLWVLLSPDSHFRQSPYPYPDWIFTWGLSVIDVLSALLILVALQSNSFAYKVLSTPQLRWMGRVSYGAYVLHDIPHLLYLKVSLKLVRFAHIVWQTSESAVQLQAVVVTAVIAFTFTLILAGLSFRFFERPFLNLKERWTVRTVR